MVQKHATPGLDFQTICKISEPLLLTDEGLYMTVLYYRPFALNQNVSCSAQTHLPLGYL